MTRQEDQPVLREPESGRTRSIMASVAVLAIASALGSLAIVGVAEVTVSPRPLSFLATVYFTPIAALLGGCVVGRLARWSVVQYGSIGVLSTCFYLSCEACRSVDFLEDFVFAGVGIPLLGLCVLAGLAVARLTRRFGR